MDDLYIPAYAQNGLTVLKVIFLKKKYVRKYLKESGILTSPTAKSQFLYDTFKENCVCE